MTNGNQGRHSGRKPCRCGAYPFPHRPGRACALHAAYSTDYEAEFLRDDAALRASEARSINAEIHRRF